MQYNYSFGAVTRTQGAAPAGQTTGAIQLMDYDAAGNPQTEETGHITRSSPTMQ